VPIGRLSHHCHVGLGHDRARNSTPQERMIIHGEYADRLAHWRIPHAILLPEHFRITPQKEGFSKPLSTFALTCHRCLVSFHMQRLFSMFPLGAAGIALFLLRVSAAGMLLTIALPRT